MNPFRQPKIHKWSYLLLVWTWAFLFWVEMWIIFIFFGKESGHIYEMKNVCILQFSSFFPENLSHRNKNTNAWRLTYKDAIIALFLVAKIRNKENVLQMGTIVLSHWGILCVKDWIRVSLDFHKKLLKEKIKIQSSCDTIQSHF